MGAVELPPQLARVAKSARATVELALDQSQPSGRLILVHCLQAISSSLVTISLAGSLFFSISPKAAEGKVLLYLLLTIAPLPSSARR